MFLPWLVTNKRSGLRRIQQNQNYQAFEFTLFAKKKKPPSKCENYLCQHQTPAKFYFKIALQKVDPHA